MQAHNLAMKEWVDANPGKWVEWDVRSYPMRPYLVRDTDVYEVVSEHDGDVYRCCVRRKTDDEIAETMKGEMWAQQDLL